MPKINVTGPAYESPSVDTNFQRCVNWYPETGGIEGKDQLILLPTPGLKDFSDVAGADSVVRGLIEHQGTLYAVVDNTFYSINSAGTATSEGTLTTNSSRVQMAAIDDEIFIVDGTNGYRYVISSDTFSQITDVDFPSGTTSVTSQDGFIIVREASGNRFYISSVNDGSAWNALDFASKEGAPDNLKAVVSNSRQLWLFGERTTEVWVNTGSASFPFQRLSDVFIDWGAVSEHAITPLDNTLFWLAQSRNGSLSVVKAQGFGAVLVSTPAIANKISSYTTISDAFSYGYHLNGHDFYVLTFPTEGVTWVYDVSTNMWHERSSFVDQEDTRHRSNCYAFAFNKHLVGDFDSGSIYELDNDTYTDDGTRIRRVRTTRHFHNDNRQVTFNNLTIDVETGVGLTSGQGSDPQYMLRVSRDGGRTWGNERWRSPGKIGIYDERMVWHLLGTGRVFTFEISVTDPIKAVIIDARADITIGRN